MREHVVRFLNSMGAHVNDADLWMREFSKSFDKSGLYPICEPKTWFSA